MLALLGCRTWPEPQHASQMDLLPADYWTCDNANAIERELARRGQ